MIRKSVTELHFVNASGPMPTIEIDVNSLPEGWFGYSALVESALVPLATANPGLKATVYVFEGPSINFGDYGHSAFFGAAGSGLVLPALHSAFSKVAGPKVRHSDQIRQSQAMRQYHLEAGRFWVPDEENAWRSDGDELDATDADVEHDDAFAAKDAPDLDANNQGGADDEDLDDDDATGGMRTQTPARIRAARSDASVGTIVRSIEQVYGLPEGSVALRGQDKKALRSDATIRTLRKRWE